MHTQSRLPTGLFAVLVRPMARVEGYKQAAMHGMLWRCCGSLFLVPCPSPAQPRLPEGIVNALISAIGAGVEGYKHAAIHNISSKSDTR